MFFMRNLVNSCRVNNSLFIMSYSMKNDKLLKKSYDITKNNEKSKFMDNKLKSIIDKNSKVDLIEKNDMIYLTLKSLEHALKN